MTLAAVSSFSSRLKLIIVNTKRCVPSLLKSGASKISPNSLAIRNHTCASWCADFEQKRIRITSTPFYSTRTWATRWKSRFHHGTGPAGNAGDRRPPGAEFVSQSLFAHACCRIVSLPALVSTCWFRPVGEPSRLSWLRDDSSQQCITELARAETLGQGAALSHQ
jgi:hypothetical protein